MNDDQIPSPHDAVRNKVEAAYRRGDLFAKRQKLMEAWARYCGAGEVTGEVVALGIGRINRGHVDPRASDLSAVERAQIMPE